MLLSKMYGIEFIHNIYYKIVFSIVNKKQQHLVKGIDDGTFGIPIKSKCGQN